MKQNFRQWFLSVIVVLLALALPQERAGAQEPSSTATVQQGSEASGTPSRASPGPSPVISPLQAVILGLVEGITEYLPVSSTGHLVLTGELLGLRDPARLSEEQLGAVEAYEIVIQAGAILAVLALYGRRVKQMLMGLTGRSSEGLRLFINVVAAFLPTAVLGLLLNKVIKTYLQDTGPVIFALAAGGLLMIWFEFSRRARRSRFQGVTMKALTPQMAVLIGLAQSVAMWPGTSRSMMTILAGMALGLQPVAAAEFSFLLGLPTLLAATAFKAMKDGHLLLTHIGPVSMMVGLVVAGVTAGIAVRSFVSYLNRRGFVPFGAYRIVLAGVMALVLGVRTAF